MGDILNDILGSRTAGPGGFAGPMSQSHMSEPVMGFPSISMGGISETGAIPGSDQGREDAVVRGFKPKKRSLLGLLGDAILLHSGHKGPFFADRVRDKNISRAMEGFTQDPLEALRRVSQIPGMADDAWKMYGQYRDDQRGDRAQESLIGSRQQKIIDKANQLLGTVREDGSNYGMVSRIYNDMMARNNIDSQLPEEFDPDYVASVYAGGLTPNQQEMAKYREKRLEQQDRSLDIRQEGNDIRSKDVDSRIASREVRDNVAVRSVAVREAAETRQGKKAATKSGEAASRKVKTKYGMGDVDPSGNYLRVTGPDGGVYIYRSAGENQWKFFKKAN